MKLKFSPEGKKNVEVLLVDDSPVARKMLRFLLELDPDIKVVGEAGDGKEAVLQANRLKPTMITMDLKMPVLDGYAAIEQIMRTNPTPILVVTSSYHGKNSSSAFEALSRGALDIVQKPDLKKALGEEIESNHLVEMVKRLSGVRVKCLPGSSLAVKKNETKIVFPGALKHKIVAVGASTGGPTALSSFLGGLPTDFPLGIVIVQHITDGFEPGLVHWLSSNTPLEVLLAENGDTISPGKVYISPAQHHTGVTAENKIYLSDAPPLNNHRPSVDALFESAAEAYGNRAIGILLTGMGADGAKGLKIMRDCGAHTIAQDRNSSVVYGMPREAVKLDAVSEVAPLDKIPEILGKLVGYGKYSNS